MKARVDRQVETLGSDVTKVSEYLAVVDHPPNVDRETLASLIDKGWTFRRGDVIVMLDPQPEREYIEVVWWLPLPLWVTPDGLTCIAEAMRAVIEKYGRTARSWTISGQFDAPGGTAAERLERSTKAAMIHRRWFSDLDIRPDAVSTYARAMANLGELLDAAEGYDFAA